jgi:hypothetical protein
MHAGIKRVHKSCCEVRPAAHGSSTQQTYHSHQILVREYMVEARFRWGKVLEKAAHVQMG